MEPHYPLITLPNGNDLPTDSRKYMQWEMAIVHNVFIRALNTVWNYAPLVIPQDQYAFSQYCLVMIDSVLSHHHTEESIVFPFLSKKLSMDVNEEQHEAFQGPLKDFQKYIERIAVGEETYDGARIRTLLAAFADPLVEHLHDEIPTLVPEELGKFEKAEFDEMMSALDKHIKAEGGLFKAIPFIIGNHDSNQVPSWPPVPGALKWVVRNIAAQRHASYWKFASFDSAGQPRVYTPA